MYVSENNEFLVQQGQTFYGSTRLMCILTGYRPNGVKIDVKPYVSTNTVMCPKSSHYGSTPASGTFYREVLGLNHKNPSTTEAERLGLYLCRGDGSFYAAAGGDYDDSFYSFKRMKRPAETIIMADAANETGSFYQFAPRVTYAIWLIHSKRANIGFPDGHAAAMSLADLQNATQNLQRARSATYSLLSW